MAYAREKREQQEIASERIARLMKLAESEAGRREDELAKKHVKLARAIGMRYNVRMPKDLRRSYCRGCCAYFTTENSRTRVNSREKKVELKCLKCGRTVRTSYK